MASTTVNVARTFVRSGSVAWTWSAAAAMLPSAAAMFARPLARAAPLQQLAVGGACGAATLGMAGALDLQDPFMWGRHDKRTKKGKRHIGTYGKIRPKKAEPSPFSVEYWGKKLHWIPPGGGTGAPPRTDGL